MIRHFGFAVGALLLAGPALAQTLPGGLPAPFESAVVRVVDGDGIMVEGDARQIRLWGVDAPEPDTAQGPVATKTLSDLVTGKHVRIEPRNIDQYGRVVSRVYVGEVEINRKLIETGPATEYCRYSKNAYGTCKNRKKPS